MNNHNTISEDEHFGHTYVFNCERISIRSSIDTYIFLSFIQFDLLLDFYFILKILLRF